MRDSEGERRIYRILSDYGIDFEEEYTFPDLIASSGRPLRFDFAIFDLNGDIDFLIEFQGKQHYTKVGRYGGAKGFYRQQHNDAKKRQYCLQHDIKLVSIPYYDEDKLTYDYIMRAAGY